jgi:hypothetical protein
MTHSCGMTFECNKPSPWGRSAPASRNPEKEIEKLKRQFQAVSRKSFRRQPTRWLRHLDWTLISTIGAIVAIIAFLCWRWAWNSNLWPANQAAIQATYIRDCAEARRLGVAPLYSGYPGYRRSLDADRDGTACEPFPF